MNTKERNETIKGLWINALYSGISYWAGIEKASHKDTEYAPFKHNGFVALYDRETNSPFDEQVTKQSLLNGLKLIEKEYPHVWDDIITGNDDCETADIFVQLSIFKEIVFG